MTHSKVEITDSDARFTSWNTVLNSIEVGVSVFSPDLRLEFINDTYRKIVDLPDTINVGDAAYELYYFMAERGDFGEGSPEKLANEKLVAIANGSWSDMVHVMSNGRTNKIRRDLMDDGYIVTTVTDITDIRNGEVRVSENVSLMLSVMETTDQGIMIVDRLGMVEMVNSAYEDMLGFVGDPEKSPHSYYDLIEGAWKEGKFLGDEINALTDEEFLYRTVKMVERSADEPQMLKLSNNKYVRFISRKLESERKIFTFTDVTDSKIRELKSAEAHQRSEDMLADFIAAINNMDVGLVLLDNELNTLIINDAFHEIWSTSPENFQLGQSFRQLMDINRGNGIYDVEDSDWEDYVKSRLDEIGDGDIEPREFERADGKILIYSCTELSNGQRLVRYSDITDSKQREVALDIAHREAENTAADFGTALNNMDVGLLLLDNELNALMINDPFYEIWNMGRDEFDIGSNVRQLMEVNRRNNVYGTRDEDWQEDEWSSYVSDRIAKVEEGNIPPNEFCSSDGRVFVFSCTALSGGKRLIRYSNITEYKQREAALEAAQVLAQKADRSKSEFLANMSHEIRTPMNGVMGMAELLAKSDLDSKQQMFTDVILSSSTALLTIINDILDFSKIEAGKLELDPTEFGLREAIEDVATLVSTSVAEKNLELIVRVQPDLPDQVVGDVGRIRQVLTNLIGNAVKFTEQGHVFVDVSGELQNGNASLKLSVKDTGIGIPEDQIDSVFEKFSQVDGSSTRRHEGTGLGLAITSRLIALMGGEIGCNSVLGDGSDFWIEFDLPLGKSQPKEQTNSIDIRGARVLAIDDNSVNRSILLEQFSSWHLKGTSAASGLEGLAMMRQAVGNNEPFDIVVLDYHMPDMNGIDVARVIKADDVLKKSAIVMLTSVDNISESSEFKVLGIDAHLTKPARASQLLDSIVDVMPKIGNATQHFGQNIPNNDVNVKPSTALFVEDKAIDGRTAREEKPDGKVVAAAGRDVTGDKIEILVAEDNEVNQMVFEQILEHLGYTFKIVGNGKLAVDEIDHLRPTIVLMDVSMPVMNGLDATAAIRKMYDEEIETSYRPVIIGVTAHALKDDREKCIGAGMDDYLSKPVSPDMLAEKINLWMQDSSAGKIVA